MKLNISVTPLYGAQSDDHAISTLLSIEGFNILLDCGWNSLFDPAFLKNLADVAPEVHVVLLSHADVPHLGALPYASSKLGLKAPIFATLPVWRMGQMFMYDSFLSEDAQKPFNLFNLDDVDSIFDYFNTEREDSKSKDNLSSVDIANPPSNLTRSPDDDNTMDISTTNISNGTKSIESDSKTGENTPNKTEPSRIETPKKAKKARFTLLKYQQSYALKDLVLPDKETNNKKLRNIVNDIVIVPHRAGHMIGGTVWNIIKDTVNIVYAVHINHRKERHLSPTTLVNFSRPSHLILSSSNSQRKSMNNVIGEDVLMNTITSYCKNQSNSNALIPIDTAGRLIEIAVQLDNLWENDSHLRDKKKIFILHPLSIRTFDFARSMIEWSSDEFMTSFDITRKNMFQFKHIQLIQDIATFDSLMSSNRGKQSSVVLASSPYLQCGPSKSLFIRWAANPNNVVILVNKPEPGTLYSKIYEHAETCSQSDNKILELEVEVGKKVPLVGEELEAWRAQERLKKQEEADKKRREEEQKRQKEEEEEGKRKEELEKEKERKRKRKLEEQLKLTGDNEIIHNLNLNDEDERMDALHENIIDKDLKEMEYEELILNKLRVMGVIPKGRCETFEYNNGAIQEDLMLEWDEYGQKVDVTRFIIGDDPGDGVKYKVENMKPDKVVKKEEEVKEEEEVIPTKYVSENVKVIIKCGLVVADCCGLSDGDSIRHLVKEIEPRHVSIIGGTEKESLHLGEILKKALTTTTTNIVMPKVLETIHMVSDINVYRISLHDALVKSVHWEQMGMAKIGFVKGRITDEYDSKGFNVLGLNNRNENSISITPDEEEMDFAVDDVLDITGRTVAKDGMDIDTTENGTAGIDNSNESDVIGDDGTDENSFGTFFVGTILLNKLKDRIVEAGIKAEFAGGALCVENPDTGAVILVKKVGGQHISLQGSLCEEYYTIQDLLYKQVVIPR